MYVGYTPDGYDLFSVQLNEAQWAPVGPLPTEPTRTASSAITQTSSETPARTYSPLRTIAPRFWTPTLESDEGEVVVGAAIGSTDALGRHVYGAEVGWAGRARPDWQLAYAYDRWRPTFFMNVADDTDPWRDDTIRTVEANAGLLFPVRRVRWSQSFLAAIHSSTETLTCGSCPGAAEDTGELRSLRRALRFGWIVDDARSYGYSISREDGWTMRVTTELTRAAFGADGDAEAATFDIRGYLPVVPEHGVIAVRFAVAASQGDPAVRRMFSASGTDPQTLTFDFGSDAVGLVRGLGSSDLLGTRAAVVNLDYRLPLKQIERGVGTLPIFARVAHGAVFVDAGHAWTGSFSARRPHRLGRRATLARRCRRLCPAADIHDRLFVGLPGTWLRGVRNHRPLLLASCHEPELPSYRTTEQTERPNDRTERPTDRAPAPSRPLPLTCIRGILSPPMATPDLYGQAVRALEQGRGADATTLLVRA